MAETPTRVVLATRNAGKVRELEALLADALPGVELVALPADAPDPVEDGDSFEANALIKARSAVAWTGLPALADDSGLEVDALGGAPGIHTARYAGTRDDRDNYLLLLANLEGRADRAASFVCAAAFVTPGGFEHVELRRWPGEILLAPTGTGGHGYDPVFRGEGESRSSAEMSLAEKNAVSHRTRAFLAIAPTVARHLGDSEG